MARDCPYKTSEISNKLTLFLDSLSQLLGLRIELDHARLNWSKYAHHLLFGHQIVHIVAELCVVSVQEAEYKRLNVHYCEFNSSARMTTSPETDILIGLFGFRQKSVWVMGIGRGVNTSIV